MGNESQDNAGTSSMADNGLNLQTGDWCVVLYDGEQFPGEVLSIVCFEKYACQTLKGAVADSLKQPVDLISSLFSQLKLKEQRSHIYSGAINTDNEHHMSVLDDLIERRSGSKIWF